MVRDAAAVGLIRLYCTLLSPPFEGLECNASGVLQQPGLFKRLSGNSTLVATIKYNYIPRARTCTQTDGRGMAKSLMVPTLLDIGEK